MCIHTALSVVKRDFPRSPLPAAPVPGSYLYMESDNPETVTLPGPAGNLWQQTISRDPGRAHRVFLYAVNNTTGTPATLLGVAVQNAGSGGINLDYAMYAAATGKGDPITQVGLPLARPLMDNCFPNSVQPASIAPGATLVVGTVPWSFGYLSGIQMELRVSGGPYVLHSVFGSGGTLGKPTGPACAAVVGTHPRGGWAFSEVNHYFEYPFDMQTPPVMRAFYPNPLFTAQKSSDQHCCTATPNCALTDTAPYGVPVYVRFRAVPKPNCHLRLEIGVTGHGGPWAVAGCFLTFQQWFYTLEAHGPLYQYAVIKDVSVPPGGAVYHLKFALAGGSAGPWGLTLRPLP